MGDSTLTVSSSFATRLPGSMPIALLPCSTSFSSYGTWRKSNYITVIAWRSGNCFFFSIQNHNAKQRLRPTMQLGSGQGLGNRAARVCAIVHARIAGCSDS